MAPGNNRVSGESTQASRADLCYVKRCSCVVFSLQAGKKDLTNTPKVFSDILENLTLSVTNTTVAWNHSILVSLVAFL